MLKSVESNIRAFVKFTNASKRTLEVHWINFLGEEVHYTNLNPGGNCMVGSLHCWSSRSLRDFLFFFLQDKHVLYSSLDLHMRQDRREVAGQS